MQSINQNVLELLKEKANHLNRTFQQFQREIKCVIHQIMDKELNNDKKSMYNNKINELCSDYSLSINRLEIQYLIKCEQSFIQSNPPIQTNPSSTPLTLIPDDDNNHNISSISPLSFSESPQPHECSQCDAIYSSEYSLQKHIKTEHYSNNTQKPKQHRIHQKKDKVRNYNHNEMDDGISSSSLSDCDIKYTHKCNECNASYTASSSLRRHKLKYHSNISALKPQSKHECDVCGQVFMKSRGLGSHKAIKHRIYANNKKKKTNKKHKCRVCDKTFKSGASLGGHMKIHKNIVCNLCDKTFKSQQELLTHIRDVHNGYSMECDECNKKFKYNTDLMQHIKRKHNGCMNMIECNECDEIFKDKLELNRHRNTVHSVMDQNPLKCDICNKVYASKYSLKLHKLLHSDKTFECEHCSMSFKLEHYLIPHIKYVHNKDPWKCDECHETFRVKWDLKRHRKTVHKTVRDIDIIEERNNNDQQNEDGDTEILDDASIGKTDDIEMPLDDTIELNESKNEASNSEDLGEVCGICNKSNDNEANNMIECRVCTEKYHYLCVGTNKESLKSNEAWKCGLCCKKEDSVDFNSNNSDVVRPKRTKSLFNRRL